jgi:hypothetical protein
VFETPFTGRVDSLPLVGVLVMVAALVVLRLNRWSAVRDRWLVAAVAFIPPLGLLALSAVAGGSFLGHMMLPRYAAAAAPMMIVVVAVAVVSVRPPVFGLAIAAAVLAVSAAGLASSHRASGFYLDARGVAHYVTARREPGDVVLAVNGYGELIPLRAYGLYSDRFGSAATKRLVAKHRQRLWLVTQLPTNSVTLTTLRQAAALPGYRATDAQVFPSVSPVGVVLEAPLSQR